MYSRVSEIDGFCLFERLAQGWSAPGGATLSREQTKAKTGAVLKTPL